MNREEGAKTSISFLRKTSKKIKKSVSDRNPSIQDKLPKSSSPRNRRKRVPMKIDKQPNPDYKGDNNPLPSGNVEAMNEKLSVIKQATREMDLISKVVNEGYSNVYDNLKNKRDKVFLETIKEINDPQELNSLYYKINDKVLSLSI